MDVDQLRALLAVAQYGSFSKAAAVLGHSQPALSRQVQHLERELGTSLFQRDCRPVAPTPAGRDFLAAASEVIQRLDAAIVGLSRRLDVMAGGLLVVASTIPGEFLVPNLLARFTTTFAEVRPNLTITDSAGVVDRLLDHTAEVGFLGTPHSDRRLRLTPFAEDEIVLALPTGHPLATKDRISIHDLAGQPFVERSDGSGTLDSVRRLLARSGERMPDHRIVMVVGTSQAHIAAIAAGVGMGFVSRRIFAGRTRAEVVARCIDRVDLTRILYIAHERAPLSPIAEAFLRFVLEAPSFGPKLAP